MASTHLRNPSSFSGGGLRAPSSEFKLTQSLLPLVSSIPGAVVASCSCYLPETSELPLYPLSYLADNPITYLPIYGKASVKKLLCCLNSRHWLLTDTSDFLFNIL